MSRREAALEAQLGPLTEVVVARSDLPAGRVLRLTDLGVRSLPARYAPAGEAAFAAALAGQRLAVPVVAGAPVTPSLIERRREAPLFERGERAVDVIASGSASAGARVDVVVTTERRTRLALEDVEVLAARATSSEKGPRVVATLRVAVSDAVYLVAAQSFAQDVRLLGAGARGRA